MKVFIDLFCGLGGASTAFCAAPGWKVIRIDNNEALIPHVHGMILADITDVHHIQTIIATLLFEHTDEIEQIVIWASPPCTEFSLANPNRPEEPDMTCLVAAKELIEWICTGEDTSKMKPLWAIENVKGAIDWFNEELEMPWHQRIGPFFLWGTIPWIDFRDADDKLHKKTGLNKGSRALRPNIRAKIPDAVSQALLDSLELQTKLNIVFE
jgi:site-specific DNA-cytosine methylase